MSDSVCPVCKIEPPSSDHPEFITPIYTPGVRHDASNLDCPSVPRLTSERAAALTARLEALNAARARAMRDARNVWIR